MLNFSRLAEENYHSVSIVRSPTVYGYSKNLRLGTGLNRVIFDAHFKARVSIHGVTDYQGPHIYIDDLIAALVDYIGDVKVGVGYVSFESVMLEDLILGLNDVFQNLDVIYLEQDQLVKTLRIKSYADSIERLPSGLTKNIKAMSDWFIY